VNRESAVKAFFRIFRAEFHDARYVISEELSRGGKPHFVIRIPAVHPRITKPLVIYIDEHDFSWGWVDGHHDHCTLHKRAEFEQMVRISMRQVRHVISDRVILGTNRHGNARTMQWMRPVGSTYPVPKLEPGEHCNSVSWTGRYDAEWVYGEAMPSFLNLVGE